MNTKRKSSRPFRRLFVVMNRSLGKVWSTLFDSDSKKEFERLKKFIAS